MMDDEVDELNRAIFHTLTRCIQDRPEHSQQALDVIIIARNLERVGDHATNIAEDVIFWVRGADVRHHLAASG
jgi:phosphate transport system protein